MIQIDMDFKMPSCCNECQMCSCQRIGMFYCDLTAEYIDIDSDLRDADCPLKEVPSGKWEHSATFDEHKKPYSMCSNCRSFYLQENIKGYKYCPNCGTKMEQGETK